MQVNIGAKVVTREGRDAGLVDRVIFNPENNELLSIVVHSGQLAGRDIVVPMGEIERATKEGISLRITTSDLARMPDFMESEYAPPPRHWVPPAIYPPAHVLVPLPSPVDLGQPTVEEPPHRLTPPTRMPQPAISEGVTISEGTEVYCTDGRVGTVDEVITDQRTNRVTSFVVRKGRWFPKDVVVPASLVSRVHEYRITLACRKDELNGLPTPPR